jgi:DNA-binding protein H-NS
MTTLHELIAQKEALDQQIAEAQRQAKADGIAKVRALMTEHEVSITVLSLILGADKSKAGKTTADRKVAPKYRDPETGKTWTGRGVAPKWIAGKDREAFLITV